MLVVSAEVTDNWTTGSGPRGGSGSSGSSAVSSETSKLGERLSVPCGGSCVQRVGAPVLIVSGWEWTESMSS